MSGARETVEGKAILSVFVCVYTHTQRSQMFLCVCGAEGLQRMSQGSSHSHCKFCRAGGRASCFPEPHSTPLLLDNLKQGIHSAPKTRTIPRSSRMVQISSKPLQNILEDWSHCHLGFTGPSKSENYKEGYVQSREPARSIFTHQLYPTPPSWPPHQK